MIGAPDPEHRRSSNLRLERNPPMRSNLPNRRVSPLRARMIEDMTVRGFTEKTRQDYVRHVHAFAAFIGRSPTTATVGRDRQSSAPLQAAVVAGFATSVGLRPP